MNIKRRVIISNTIMVLIPFLITIAVALGFLFIATRFLHKDSGYKNFKKLAIIRNDLNNIIGSINSQNQGIDDDIQFQQYLSQRLSNFDGKYIIVKGNNSILASKDFNKIDIEKFIEEEKKSLDGTIEVNGVNYILQGSDVNLKDGTFGRIILLAPVEKGTNLIRYFLITTLFTFAFSFIVVNAAISYYFSKNILRPIELLKKAASEISSGNLDCEVIEEGDEEIKELCHNFEVMRIQLKDSINLKKKYDDNRKLLVSSISHDLKTPITSIKGYVEGILDGVANTPEKLNSYLKTIYSKAEHINGLIEDLLLYSKLDLNQIPFNFQTTDIVEYFNYCIEESEQELEKNGIKIKLKNDLSISKFVILDRERMRRVILNIIDNSRKYMDKKDGEIIINLRETNSSIIAEIKDNGPGIREDEINKIFDRFYRIDKSRSSADGSGLGLAIAKQIVEGHKGRIWAVSHENNGTSIMISLAKLRKVGEAYEENIDYRR